MANDDNIQKLSELIDIELDGCNKLDWPHVCNMASNPKTRKEIKDMIIKQCATSGCSVGVAMDNIEKAYNPNRMDD
jgi:hypothetical protein